MLLRDTWEDGVDCLSKGSVTTWDGRPVHFRSLIQRRWGWPKKAAYAAADWIEAEAAREGRTPALWITNPWRSAQQQRVIDAVPGIIMDLFSGLARGASKNADDADRVLSSIHVEFDQDLSDDGLVREVTAVIANRLGASLDEVRGSTEYGFDDDGRVKMFVRSLELKE